MYDAIPMNMNIFIQHDETVSCTNGCSPSTFEVHKLGIITRNRIVMESIKDSTSRHNSNILSLVISLHLTSYLLTRR